jgi:DNA replication protein DnaC
MERLSNILGRTTPRRTQETQPTQGAPNRGPRQNAVPQQYTGQHPAQMPTARRPLPEQTGRLARPQYQGGTQQRQLPPHAHLRNAQAAQNRSAEAYTQKLRVAQDYQQYDEPPASRPQQPPLDTAPTHYPTRPRLKQDVQRTMPPLPPNPYSSNNYYHTDDHGPALPADVYQEQEYVDEDDMDANMLYGDYLDDEDEYLEEDEEIAVYQRQDIAHLPAPRNSYQMSREVPALPPPSAYPRQTRDLRPTQYTQPPASQLPPSRAQEAARYQRTTQPLKPQMIAETRQQLAPEPQHYSRQLMTREQARTQSRAPERFATIPVSSVAPIAAKSVCPRCKGAGYLRLDVPFGHPNFGKPIACECKETERKEKRRQQLREMSNLDAFHSHTFSTFNPNVPGVREAFQVSVGYAQNPDGWLLLIGPNGCGKTHLAASIANQNLDNGSVVLFSVVPDLLDHLRAAFAPNATEVFDQLFAKMREAEVLVLDDLGAQQSSPWANEKLFQLLNYRYNLGMPTVITANPRGLQGIDERIRSRLGDVSLVKTVNLDRSRDYRPNHARRRD